MRQLFALCVMSVSLVAATSGQSARGTSAPAPVAGPRMTMETAKGTIEIEFFQTDAPKSVAQIVGLAKRNFYRGQRFHRVEASLVQFGDPASRDVSRQAWWGRSSSGNPIGEAEFNRHTHVRGAVSLAHSGSARGADSQLFIMKTASPGLNKVHVVIGRVTRGMEVVDKIQVADLIKQATITEAAPR